MSLIAASHILLQHKLNDVRLDRSDFVESEDDPMWKTLHPLGPVHFQFRCRLCGAIVLTDQPSSALSLGDGVWRRVLPHFEGCRLTSEEDSEA